MQMKFSELPCAHLSTATQSPVTPSHWLKEKLETLYWF